MIKVRPVSYPGTGIGGAKTSAMHVLTGHLTAHDKQAIKAILDAGLTAGRVGRKEYHLSQANGIYTVKQMVMDRGMIPVPGSALRLSTYTATFTLARQQAEKPAAPGQLTLSL